MMTIQRLKRWVKENKTILLILTGVIFLCYVNTLDNRFVSDDFPGIAENPNLGKFSYVFRHPLRFLRPFFYFVIHSLFGKIPAPFRMLNILFHLGNSILLFTITRHILNKRTATISSILFAVHPLMTESVTWITGGIYSQHTFFFFLSFAFYLKADNKKSNYPLSLLFFGLTLISSIKAFTTGLIFPFYEFTQKKLRKNLNKYLPHLLGTAAFALYFGAQIGDRIGKLQTKFYQQGGSYFRPFVQVPTALARYLELLFWPRDLSLYQKGFPNYWLAVIITAVYLGLLIYIYQKNKRIFFFFSLFLVALLPFLTPFRIAWHVAERYCYLASVGIIVPFAFVIDNLLTRGGKCISRLGTVFLILAVCGLIARTIIRNNDWQNRNTLWPATAKVAPENPKLHNNLGDVYAQKGNLQKAASEFELATKLLPGYADAYHNWGNVLRRQGKTEQAIEKYQQAISHNPQLWQSHSILAEIYFNQENFEKAKNHFSRSVNIYPKNIETWFNLAITYSNLNQHEKAINIIENLSAQDPGNEKIKTLRERIYQQYEN
ncbi:MAG: tetratricopeptide repeat protein [Patescibacteria group bacterium]